MQRIRKPGKDKIMTGNLRKIVFFILLLGITYFSFKYMIKPANKGLAEQKARVLKKKVKLAEIEKATMAANDLNEQLEHLQNAIESLEDKLPSNEEIHKVLEQVTLIAQKQGLKPKTIRTLKKKNNSGYIEQPLKMELVGDFSSFYSFLLELEKLPRITKIRELKLRKSKEGNIKANFIISIFFQNSGIS